MKLLLTDPTPEMRRRAKRSRNAAGKSLGDMCAAQKALATVGSSVRGGASASMVSSTVAVLPILFFTGLVARDFWKTAPPLAAVPNQHLAFEFEAGSPSQLRYLRRRLARSARRGRAGTMLQYR